MTETVTVTHLFVRCPLQIVTYVFRGIRITSMSVAVFGGCTVTRLLLVAGGKTPATDQQANQPFLSRTFETAKIRLQYLCRPASFYVPLLSSMTAVLFAFRALEDHHMSLLGTEEYHKACPEGSRRTSTGVFVKLFAATVTTVGVHGHLSSLNGSRSWKRELFCSIEVSTNPLAPVFLFSTELWYGCIDLLRIRLEPLETKITLTYRFARLCGCRLNSTSEVERSFSLSAVAPCHLKTTRLERDLKWVGRVLILLILFGQYTQAAVLLIRRILSNTAVRVDYAMLLLVLSGLVALCQSIAISLLNVSWILDTQIQPCTQPHCSLPECTSLKKEQGLPNEEIRAVVFGLDITPIPQTILYCLAGGYAQMSIFLHFRGSFWEVLLFLCGGHLFWQTSIYYIFYIHYLRKDLELARTGILYVHFLRGLLRPAGTMDPSSYQQQPETVPAPIPNDSQGTSDQQQSETLPSPVPNNSRRTSDQRQSQSLPAPIPDNSLPNGIPTSALLEALLFSDALVFIILFIVGIADIIWLCFIIIVQLFYLVAPCIFLYTRIPSETAAWKNADLVKPCPELWKDNHEDELWWF